MYDELEETIREIYAQGWAAGHRGDLSEDVIDEYAGRIKRLFGVEL